MLVELNDIAQRGSEEITKQFTRTALHVETQTQCIDMPEENGSQGRYNSLPNTSEDSVSQMPREHAPEKGDHKIAYRKRHGSPPNVGRHMPLSQYPIHKPPNCKNLKGDRKPMEAVEKDRPKNRSALRFHKGPHDGVNPHTLRFRSY